MTTLIDAIDIDLTFNDNTVRIFGTVAEPLFAVKDICDILGLSNTTETLRNVDKDYQHSVELKAGFSTGMQLLSTVKEPGLYQIIMRCRKDIAKPFQRWVCGEVLPSLRKKGEYKMKEDYCLKLKEIEKELLLKDEIIENKNFQLASTTKELEVATKKLEKSEGIREKFLKRRKRTPYEAGNVVYILTNPSIKNEDDSHLFRIGISTQTGEDNVAFRNRLSVYNTSVPQNFIVKALLYVEDNATIEQFIFKSLRDNLTDSDKSWIKGIEFEKLTSMMKSMCEMLNYDFRQIIFNDEEDIKKFDEEVKMEMDAILKTEKDYKNKVSQELEKIKNETKREQEYNTEEEIKLKRWNEVIDSVLDYSNEQLENVIAEFKMEKRKGREITRTQVKSRLTLQKTHPELYLDDDQKTDAIKQRILKNLPEYTIYEMNHLCKKYTLGYSSRVEDMKDTVRDFIVNNAVDTRRRRNTYAFNTNGDLVETYSSVAEFQEKTGISRNSIYEIRDMPIRRRAKSLKKH